MSKADQQFVSMCRDILDHGTTTEGQKVRPVWEDGTPAYTIKNFGVTARYDLREEFPALTLRRTALKSAMDEILWIYQKKSNNVHDLNSHIWDEWADETGSIGKRYRREDEIGTPYCITVDFDTVGDEAKGIVADNCVTVRDRDTMEQVRMPISELKSYIESKIEF